jgi:arylamine N-acetyltransferase
MISEIIKIIKQDYETVPYHNFWLVLETGLNPSSQGGICTDRNFYLFQKLKRRDFSVKLHSAQINGKNIHQLIKIDIENKPFLIDVGLGWAIMQPIPLNYESEQNSFGVNFKTKIINNQLYLYKVSKEKESLNYITNITEYNQKRIITEINDSYNKEINYPFRKSIRFSKVVNNEFYFLKGNILFYSKNNMLSSKPINTMIEFENLFQNIFKFDLEIAMKVANKLKMFK